MVVFSEVCSVCLVWVKRWTWFANNYFTLAFTVFCCCNLSLKMIINVYQWTGAVERLSEYKRASKVRGD